jgi:hypothetical protein
MSSLKPWIVDPVWQNYSSMYREAVAAREARSGVEQSHHLTASLYFAISTLEAFLNHKWREHFKATKLEEDLLKELRFGKLMDKVKKWPKQVTGRDLALRRDAIDTISLFSDVRSNLTHPKHDGPTTWRMLDNVEPESVVDVVAEYITQFHAAQGRQFDYWLWGWNYLNPSESTHEIMPVNNQQFVFSMQALGEQVVAWDVAVSEAWRKQYMSDYVGYRAVVEKLSNMTSCEPKDDRFPYQPKLCRRWWEDKHHKTCGFVTREAIDYAINCRRGQDGYIDL